MIIDSSLQMCNATAVANAAGTFLLGSQIDTTVAGTLEVENLHLVIVATTAIVAAGAGTIQFKLASDTTAAVSTTTSLDEVITPAFVTANNSTAIPAGTLLYSGKLPHDIGTLTPSRRFLGILEVVGTSTISSGNISAFLTADVSKWAATATVVN